MPKAPRRCPTPGCPNLIRHTQYCPDHTEAWAGSTRGQATSHSGWRRLREQILERDNYTCYLCGRPGADTVDHIVSVARGGSDIPSNLGAVHDRVAPHCHRAKTNREK
ncbi:HNH endonuclease [Nocardia spumae]|uniref:HNH endonuclease n=1 Tax=Nocardia spumae TaxID=2887190 RepID=UPI001D159495|nr:HNH endonuclease [Nocardia spumae]